MTSATLLNAVMFAPETRSSGSAYFSAFFFVYYGGTAGMFSFILYSLLQFLGILAFFVLGASIRYIEPLKRGSWAF